MMFLCGQKHVGTVSVLLKYKFVRNNFVHFVGLGGVLSILHRMDDMNYKMFNAEVCYSRKFQASKLSKISL